MQGSSRLSFLDASSGSRLRTLPGPRTILHLSRVGIEEGWLAEIEARDNIFLNVGYTVYCREFQVPPE
jgi:hypothetical protein